MSETKAVPLTCHGHSRPITHLTFSPRLPSSSGNDASSPTNAPSPSDTYFLLSACKDLSPMLRDGQTGDWIGTFLGHKGAVWSSRLSADAGIAVTGSADFTAKVWDAFTGECLATLHEAHIVRAVAVSGGLGITGPAGDGGASNGVGANGSASGRRAGLKIATGGMEKRVKLWDLGRLGEQGDGERQVKDFSSEVGKGVHGGTIKSLLWTAADRENGLVSAADDKFVRWWDLRQPERPVAQHQVDGLIGSCELNDVDADDGGGAGTLTVAAGKSVYFFDGARPGHLLKQVKMPREVSCAAVHSASGRFVTGSGGDTWVRVWDYATERELETLKGHHGPVWTVSFSPDGKLYATGSEDGTIKLWKATREPYGLWR